jgi:hypothetical protein
VILAKIALGMTTLMAAQALVASALSQERSRQTAYRVQLSHISVQATRSRRTDTGYAAISVQVGDTEAGTLTRRIGNVGRGTKVLNMSLPKIVAIPQARVKIGWALVNYGGEKHDAMVRVLAKATEEQVIRATDVNWMTELSEAVSPLLEERTKSCDGPLLAASFEISSADLRRQLRPGKPWRVTRRQRGTDAPSRCQATSDYAATVVIFSEP